MKRRKTTLWQRIRPKGVRFSMAGSVMLLFTGTSAYLMVRFPHFHSLKVAFLLFLLLNSALFIRWRERGQGFWERVMQSRFFPRKLSLTLVGKFLVLISIGIGFAAVNTGSNLLYLLMSMLLSIIMASGILSELSIRSVDMELELPTSAVAETETLFPIRVRNDKRRTNSFSLEGAVIFERFDADIVQAPGLSLKLEPGTSETVFPRVRFPRRGLYRLKGVTLSTSYPFSFFTKSRNVELPREVLVLPLGNRPMAPLIARLGRGYEEHANRSGRGTEFFSVRPMFPGDEWRDVHWKQTARSGHFSVKEYEALTSRRIHVALFREPGDVTGGPLDFEAEEEGIELAASGIRVLVQAGFEVGLHAPGALEVVPQVGEIALRGLFRGLAILPLESLATRYVPPLNAAHRDLVLAMNLTTGRMTLEGNEGPPVEVSAAVSIGGES